MAPKQPRPRLRRTLIVIAVLAALVPVLICTALFFVPRIASTDKARGILVSQLEKTLERDVNIENIDWSWSEGITLSGFRIAGPPEAAGGEPFVSAPRVRLEIYFSELLSRCLGFSLVLKAPEVSLIRNQKGRLLLPLPAAADRDEKKPEKPGKAEKPPAAEALRLPADINADIRMENGFVKIDDRSRKSRLEISELNIRVRAPSLVNEPAEVTVSASASADGQKPSQASIHARLRDIFDKNRRLSIHRAKARLTASLPFASMKITGDMEKSGLRADLSLDLKTLCRTAAPFAPEIFGPLHVSGKLRCGAEITREASQSMAFSADLTGTGLAASGELLRNKSLGPGDVQLSAAGRLNPEKMDLEIEKAELGLLQNSRIACTGNVSGMDRESPRLDLTVAPLEIDIQELFAFGRDFLPQGISLGGSGEGASVFVENIHFRGGIFPGEAKARIQGARLRASELRAEPPLLPGAALCLADLELVLSDARAVLSDMFPQKAQISGSLGLESLDYATEKGSFRIKQFLLKTLSLSADGIAAAKNSPYGVAADVQIDEAAETGYLSFGNKFSLSGLSQELSLALSLGPDGRAEGTVSGLRLAGEKVRLERPGKKPVSLPVALEMTLANLALRDIKAEQITMEGLSARMDMGDLLSANLNAGLAKGGRKHFAASADAQINAGKAADLFSLQEQSGIEAGGRADITMEVSGRLPREQEISGLQSLALSGNLGFLKNCRLRVSLADGFLALPADAGPAGLRIGKIAADPLLSYNLTGNNASGRIRSSIHFEEMDELILGKPRTPVSGSLSFDLRHTGAGRIEGSQEVRLMPGDIRQFTDFALEGMEKALSRNGVFARASAVNGRASAGFFVKDGRAMAELLPEESAESIESRGTLNAGIRLEKQPDNRVNLSLDIDARDFSAAMDESFSVAGLNSRISLGKSVKLVRSREKKADSAPQKWLSRKLLQTSTQQMPESRTGSINRQGRMGGAARPGLSFDSARFQAGSLCLAAGPSRLRLGLYQGLPQVEAFAIEILEGTLAGDISLLQEDSGYRAEASLNFTGIQPASLFAAPQQEKDISAREISGSLYAGLPLATEMDTMLENTEIRMNFREIGSNSLERLLYAIDPHEENEAIVSQRRLLRLGSPKSIIMGVKDGSLSLSGEISVKSVPISIPPLNRLNIAGIPGLNTYEPALSALEPLISALDMATADTLALEPANNEL
ncbi:MAG: hypothetical protein R6X08_07805 [Desulfosalsimonadaceae bacterium]